MSKDNRDMSEKSLEDKFQEWFQNNCVSDQYEHVRGLFNVVWLKDAHKAGYELAQKEMQEKLDAAIEVIKFYAYEWEQDQSVFGGYGTYMTSLKNDTEEISKNTRSYGKRARDFLKARG